MSYNSSNDFRGRWLGTQLSGSEFPLVCFHHPYLDVGVFIYVQLYDTNQGAQVPVLFLHPMPPAPEGFCLWQIPRDDHGILDFTL